MINSIKRFIYCCLETPLKHNKIIAEYDYAIFKVDRLGDFVLASSAIRCLIEALSPLRVCLIVSDIVVPWARKWFPQTSVIGIPNVDQPVISRMLIPALIARKALNSIRVNNVIVLRHQRNNYHAMVLGWYGHVDTIGYLPDGVLWKGETAFTSKGPLKLKKYVSPVSISSLSDRNLVLSQELIWHWELVRYFNQIVQPVDIIPFAPTMISSVHTSKPNRYIVLSPLGSSPIRDYPFDSIVSLVSNLRHANCTNMHIYIIGTASQRVRLESGLVPLRKLISAGYLSVQTKLSVEEYAQMINQAELVITVETATAHLSLAMRRPTIVLSGGGHYGHFGPWTCNSKQVWITNVLPCFNCNWNCTRTSAECITQIDTDIVAKYAKEWLSE